MSSIYKGAWATIVALSGTSSNSGLPGVRVDLPREKQRRSIIQNSMIVELLPTLKQQISESLWAQRAWTLQEQEFSTRCLYFAKQQVYFSVGNWSTKMFLFPIILAPGLCLRSNHSTACPRKATTDSPFIGSATACNAVSP